MTLNLVTIGEAMVEFSRGNDGTWTQGFAGDTLNVAWALRALLDADSAQVRYLTRVGRDPFSERFRAFLTQAGIGTDLVQNDPDRSIGLYTIENDASGEREFAYWRGQSAARLLASDTNTLVQGLIGADLVYVSGITLAILSPDHREVLFAALDAAAARGEHIAFDPNVRLRLWEDAATMRATTTRAAQAAQTVLPTFDDEVAAFGDTDPDQTIARYEALGVPRIVVKDGTRPTRFSQDGQRGTVPVTDPVTAIDTTGAGDSFNGGFLAAQMLGKDIVDAIRTGQTVSRIVVGHRGALVPMQTLSKGVTP